MPYTAYPQARRRSARQPLAGTSALVHALMDVSVCLLLTDLVTRHGSSDYTWSKLATGSDRGGRLLGKRWIRFALPALNGLRITLVGSLQRFLRREPELRKQCAGRPGRAQRLDPDAGLQRRAQPLVDRRAIESARGNHLRRRLAFAHPLDRRQPNGCQRLAIRRPAGGRLTNRTCPVRMAPQFPGRAKPSICSMRSNASAALSVL